MTNYGFTTKIVMKIRIQNDSRRHKQLPMAAHDKKVVKVGARLSKFIGTKATREKKLQAAAMQAEFTLHDTLIILCYLGKDPDPEIASQARKNLIPAARNWYNRPDRPELPEPIHEIVMKVIDRVGLGEKKEAISPDDETVTGNIGLLGLGEIIQAIDHNNRSARIVLEHGGRKADIYTEHGKVVGAVCDGEDGLEALYRAFGWVDASFRYSLAEPGPFENRINVNTFALVMDALEHAPEHDPFDSEVSRTWKIEGHLRIMNLFEIAEIFEMNSKAAVCRLVREDNSGELYFRNGRICNASLEDALGMDAACRLLAWPNANFIITRGGEEVDEVIHVGMQNLIIEAMRLLDEGITVTDKIAGELKLIDELFEGKDLVTLPVLDKVRIVFGEDELARETLETDGNPLVRKAIKVKISKTVHKYLNPATEHEIRIKAAQGKAPLSTTEKLVLLSYLSHDENPEIKEQAKQTLAALDIPTYRKGFGADLHPSVMDFLVRETIRESSLIKVAAGCDTILDETALHILQNWCDEEVLSAIVENRKLLERSPAVVAKLVEAAGDQGDLRQRIDVFEEALLQGQTDMKVEGALDLCGIPGLTLAARQGARSGTIVIEGAGKSGRVFFNRGKVIGAVAGSLEGLDALKHMMSWTNARFRYTLRTHFHVHNLDPQQALQLLETEAGVPAAPDGESKSALQMISGSSKVMDAYEALVSTERIPTALTTTLICEEGSGEVYQSRGRVTHAHVNGKEDPLHSMAALLAWSGVRFITRPSVGERPFTVDKPLNEFFSESMRLIPDEIMRSPRPGELPEWELSEEESESLYHRILNMGVAEKIKLAFLGSKEARSILVRDPIKLVAVAAVRSPKIREDEIEAISKSRQVCEDVLRQIASTKEWAKSYNIKLNLANNSKTPLPLSMKFLPHFREPDLRKLAKSKNIPAALATQARRLAEVKGEKG
ncbi:MAG: DUF4388 domain-containing protein [Desulfomonilaceae bacterium]|nr:DUF4388 domain-containing protein [Desulfomonilaceae bacterium]